ncbi:MAG TPA: LamG-like jellyroll fold domain-containing protein, partial [Verrucomicrobiae bacterium]|nr:LamG-like jellyroll fold domain-containing protein [Verrucomicrobiae bacterium]
MKPKFVSWLRSACPVALAVAMAETQFDVGTARAEANPPLSGLVGHWQFEEGTGLTTADSSGNGLTGTLVSGPAWVPSLLGNYALDFTTGADGVDLGNPVPLQITGALTLTAWVYADTIESNGRFIAKGGASGRRGWSLNLEGNNNWAFQIAGNSTTTIALNVPNITTGQWVHVAGVYDPTVPAMRLYLYGVLAGERTDVPTSHFNSPANAFIGRRENGTEFDGRLDEVRVFNRALTADELLNLPELVPSPVTFVTEPINRTVAQFRSVTFSAKTRGTPPHFYQWLQNGVPIPNATAESYTIPSATLDLSGSTFAVTVNNFTSSITSSNAVLTVTEDDIAPTLVSVGSADGIHVGVCFSELMDPLSAGDEFGYEVNDGAVTVMTAELRLDGRTVLLTLDQPVTGSFTVQIVDVFDLSGNVIAADTTASATVAGLQPVDLNSPATPGSIFSCKDGDIDLTAGGENIGDDLDQGYAALKAVSGDFDVKVRAFGLTAIDPLTEAGLMARESLDPGSPTVQVLANPPPPGRGWVEGTRRATAGAEATVWGTPFTTAVMPDVWMRLRRTADLFTGFVSVDGVQWTILGRVTQVSPETMLVGLAAAAQNNDGPTTLAEFRSFGSMTFDNATLQIVTHPADVTVPQNSTATFSALAEGSGAPAAELVYQWQRDDGAGGYTNIVGANAAELSVFAYPQDHGARFRVRAYLAGLVADSTAATLTLTVDDTRPELLSATAPGQGNQVVLLFSEQVDPVTATELGRYTITETGGGAPVTIVSAALGTDGRTVILTTDFLAENSPYRVTVNGVRDLALPPNTIAPDTQATFAYNSLVGYWRFEEGSGVTTADGSGNGYTGTFVNGPSWVPSLFGNHALDFHGANDRVDVGNPPALQLTGPMTLAAWVNIDSITDNGRIITKGGGPGQRGWSLNVEGINVWALQLAVNANVNVSLNVAAVPIGKWTHVAGVYDPSGPSMRLYTNGVLGGVLTEGVPTEQHNSSLNVSIGARSVAQTFFDGRIDEVRVHARALSAASIAELGRP